MNCSIPKNFTRRNGVGTGAPKAHSKYFGPVIFLGVPIVAMIVIMGAGSLQLFADIKQPQEQIKFVIDKVQELISKGVLNQSQGNALISKLDSAKEKIEEDNAKGAINQLQGFINEINRFIKSGQLGKEEGQKLIDSTGNIFGQLGFRHVEMAEMDRGLHATQTIDLAEDRVVALAFTKNATPTAQLDFIEFTAVPSVTNVNLDINVYDQIPAELPRPDTDDFLLFADISFNGNGANFSSEDAYSSSPKITFQVDKNSNGTCKDVQLFLFNETTKAWETKQVSRGLDNGSTCVYEGSVPHFSMYAIGVKKPTGGGGVGSGGSGAGGGPALAMMDYKEPTITAYFWDPEFPKIGTDLTVNAVIMDDSAVKATLFYYGPDQTFRESRSVEMQRLQGNWYGANIPGNDLKAPGVFFWIVAEDGVGNSGKLPTKLVRILEQKP